MLFLRTRREKAAARVESNRLRRLDPADLAAEIMDEQESPVQRP